MKVSIAGEHFEFDPQRKLMKEMLELEEATGIPYGQWEAGIASGSAKSLGALAWLLWHRAGRAVKWADIESGAVELNLADIEFHRDEEPVDPTVPPAIPPASATTRAATSGRSAKSG